MNRLQPFLTKKDKHAHIIILSLSVITFILVLTGSKVKLDISPGVDVHLFSLLNAILNSLVTIFLIIGFIAVKRKQFVLHRNVMLGAILLSVIFLLSYVCYHFLSDSTPYRGIGTLKYVYYVILITHIFLAAVILPFVLYTAYRALTGEYLTHKKLTRITFPVWLYVSITGVIVYLMINPYYH
jgi:putative membrane protein